MTQPRTPPNGPSETSGTVQLLVADAGNRSAISGMLDEHFDVETGQTITDADLYLIEDHLFPEYRAELRERVEQEDPAFCPVVLIRRKRTDLGQGDVDSSAPDRAVRYDEVVDAPINPPQLIRRLNSLLVRRQQSQELMQQVSTLEKREQQLRLFEKGVESTGNGIVMTDSAGTIEYVNPALESITGYSEDDILGESPQILLHEGAREIFDEEFWQTLADQEEWEGEFIIECKNSQRRAVNAMATALHDAKNEPEGFVIALSDITERVQREQDLEDREEELDLLQQILIRYFRHNMRNDLTVIRGNAESLKEDETLSQTQIKSVEMIVENSENLIKKSETARTYSSLLGSDSELSAFDLTKLTTEAVQTVRQDYSGVKFELNVPETCEIRAREGIQLAIEELIDNAARHNDATDPWVRIQVRDGDGARLVVEDNGPGIPDREIESFEKGSETKLTHSQGVGLWLSKWVIEGVNGRLSIEVTDTGTRITAEFPSFATIGSTGQEITTLKERERQLQTIKDRMTDAILEVDADFTVTRLDERAERIFDKEGGIVVGQRLWDVLPTLADTQFETAIRNTIESRSATSVKGYLPEIDASLEFHVYPEFDGGLTFYTRDITERKEQEKALRRNTRAMDAAPIGITIADPSQDDTPLIYVNERFEELTGYDRGDIIGKNCRFLQGEDTAEEPVAAMRDAIDAEEPITVELRNYRKDGTEFWNRVSIAPVHTDNGSVSHYIGFQQDITEKREIERTLREERKFIEQALNAITDIFYVITPDGNLSRINEHACEVTGYSHAELLSMEPADIFTAEHRERVEEDIHEALETGSSTLEADLVTKDGEAIPYEFRKRRLTDPEGNIIGVVGIGRDISDRKQRERELEQQNERLDAFTSIVSHDLRNPLNVAEGGVDLAQQECESEHLERATRGLNRMEALIEDLMVFAREGERVTDFNPVDLATIVTESWATVETADATLDVEVDQTVCADASRLKQVIENFVRNAIDHGGDDVAVIVGTLNNGFYVEDDGPGIAEEDRDTVFDAGYSTHDDGSGFGLAIVKQVVDAHGWDIRATEGSDGGARFEITGVEFMAE